MSILMGSNFLLGTNLPLDAKAVAADTTARDAIVAGQRYEGLTVYVIADATNYQLQGGILDANWVDIGSGGGGGGALTVDNFTGDSVTTAFTLAVDPGSENNTWVYVDGIYQQKDTYSLVGTTLTFLVAPVLDESIEVLSGPTTPVTVGDPTLAPNRRFTGVDTSQLITDDEIYVTATCTITLLAANTVGVRPVTIIVAASGITVTITGPHLIRGETSIEMVNEHDTGEYFPDGVSKWYVK